MLVATEVEDDCRELLVEARLLGATGIRAYKPSMALWYIFELITIGYKPAVLQENACKRDREVRVLNSILLFWNGFKTIKGNQLTPTGRPSRDLLGPDGTHGPGKADGRRCGATRCACCGQRPTSCRVLHTNHRDANYRCSPCTHKDRRLLRLLVVSICMTFHYLGRWHIKLKSSKLYLPSVQ